MGGKSFCCTRLRAPGRQSILPCQPLMGSLVSGRQLMHKSQCCLNALYMLLLHHWILEIQEEVDNTLA